MRNETTVERTSARELVVVRTFNGSAATIFDAWTKPELLKQWWAPKSLGSIRFWRVDGIGFAALGALLMRHNRKDQQ